VLLDVFLRSFRIYTIVMLLNGRRVDQRVRYEEFKAILFPNLKRHRFERVSLDKKRSVDLL